MSSLLRHRIIGAGLLIEGIPYAHAETALMSWISRSSAWSGGNVALDALLADIEDDLAGAGARVVGVGIRRAAVGHCQYDKIRFRRRSAWRNKMPDYPALIQHSNYVPRPLL